MLSPSTIGPSALLSSFAAAIVGAGLIVLQSVGVVAPPLVTLGIIVAAYVGTLLWTERQYRMQEAADLATLLEARIVTTRTSPRPYVRMPVTDAVFMPSRPTTAIVPAPARSVVIRIKA